MKRVLENDDTDYGTVHCSTENDVRAQDIDQVPVPVDGNMEYQELPGRSKDFGVDDVK